MSHRIRKMTRRVLGSVALVSLWTAPALAMADKSAVQETEQQIGSAVPEPGAALLFAAGAGLVAWSVRRRRTER